MNESPREIAAQVLRRRHGGGEFVETLLEQALPRAKLAKLDRALCQELVYGVVRWEMTLDWLVARKTSPRPQSPAVQILLRLGLYQIFWLQRIPAHAAVHETVELARRMGCAAQAGFLNAVLRGYTRERETVLAQLAALQDTDPALGYSHPKWLVERWQSRWGREKTKQLLEWNNSPPPTFARLNLLKTDAATLTSLWQSEETAFTPRQWDWTGENLVYELSSHPSVTDWPAFQKGYFYIQDPSTLLAVQALDPQPGETILDLCAAPGGKTTFIAQRMRNLGLIVAHDNQPQRLRRLQDNCSRLGATCVETTTNLLPLPPNPKLSPPLGFHRILVDAPCSNTGVLRRRVDLRWRVTLQEIERLRLAQLALLAQAARQLKPGGRLVYSTCSLEPEENEAIVGGFLSSHPGFTLHSQRQIFPSIESVDGAFAAVLRRSPPS